jgi:antitoxin MazE
VLVNIKRWGNSASVRIPSAVLKAANLAIDDQVDVREQDGLIIIQPVGKRYDVEELVAAITPENRHDEVSFGPAVGKEQL